MAVYQASERVGSLDQQWTHPLPRVAVVRKDPFLKELVRGKRIVHAGFSGRNEGALAVPIWVHGELAQTAKELVGLDVDEQGIEAARAAGYQAVMADCQDPEAIRRLGMRVDMVVAGELIEHLDCPGLFLEAMHHLSDTLVITTPNAYSLVNFVSIIRNQEMVHPDHIALYSWHTLTTLLGRHGWNVNELLVYRYENGDDAEQRDLKARGKRMLTDLFLSLQGAVSRIRPFYEHGLIAICKADPAHGSGST